MEVRQRKKVQAVRVRVTFNIPAWVIKDLGFKPGDEADWQPLVDDNGVNFVGLRRIAAKEKEGEGEEKEEGEEKKGEEVGGKEKEGEEGGK